MYINKKNNRVQTTIIHMSSSLPYFYLRIYYTPHTHTHIRTEREREREAKVFQSLSARYFICIILVCRRQSPKKNLRHHKINAWKATQLPCTRNAFVWIFSTILTNIYVAFECFCCGCCGYCCLIVVLFIYGCRGHMLWWDSPNEMGTNDRGATHTKRERESERGKRETHQTKFVTITKKISHKIWYLRACEYIWMRNVSQFFSLILSLFLCNGQWGWPNKYDICWPHYSSSICQCTSDEMWNGTKRNEEYRIKNCILACVLRFKYIRQLEGVAHSSGL